MKRFAHLLFVSLFVPLVAFVAEKVNPTPREVLWKEVEEAISKGLPKTAVKKLEPIIEGAVEEKAYAEAIKAVGKKISLEGVIQGNQPAEKVNRMKEAIAEAPEEMKPAMEAVLANWYWHYFQRNRWRFMQRTATAEAPGEDFTTWDLPRILAEIDKQFQQALSHAEVLKKIPVAEYDALLQKGSAPDSFRPTLYDFVAHEALAFYRSGEQAGSRASDEFYLEADSPAFAPAEAFVKWQPETTDEGSLTLRALRLHRDLLLFHAEDEDPSAYVDADLLRLVFVYGKATGEEKNERYLAALETFVKKWADHRISARALHRWAKVIYDEGDFVEARRLALRGAKAFPDTPGGNRCHNLVRQIEAKSFHPQVERVWNDPWPAIAMRYRNLDRMHFRAVKADWLDEIKRLQRLPGYLNDGQKKRLLGLKATKEWAEELKPTPDFQENLVKLDAPRDLAPGFYYLLASPKKDFAESGNQVFWTRFWVSDLSLVSRTKHGSGFLEGFVLKAGTGEPVNGAKVRVIRHHGANWVTSATLKTDENGFFRAERLARGSHVLLAEHDGHALGSGNAQWANPYDTRRKPFERVVFFTDRSLYRPGQTIRYKGICIAVDQERDDYKTLPGRSLTVVFNDRNGQEVARQEVKANEYGSFSGSFTAPRDRLMGRMSVRTNKPYGQSFFNVEEYKRPKFEVALGGLKKPAKLGGEVKLEGNATSYVGAPIDGAKVTYRVVRQVRYPYWWSWRYWWRPQSGNRQEITRGVTKTKMDGSFLVTFTAKPDPTVDLKAEPSFTYVVYADVTDATGETRSAQNTVRIGTVALHAGVSAGSWLTVDKPVEVKVRTFGPDGQVLPASGTLKLHRVKEPRRPQRASFGGYTAPSRRGKRAPEYVPEPKPGDTRFWEPGELLATRKVKTGEDGEQTESFQLGQGLYRALFTTKDKFGKKVEGSYEFKVLDPAADTLKVKTPFLLDGPKWSVEPGEEFVALWGSGYEAARAFVEVEHRGKILQRYWTKPGATQTLVRQKVTEAMRGGFTLRVTMVRENRAYLRQQQVSVPWSNKNFSIRWERFTDKLEPAKKETWTAVIEGKDAKKAVAEMVATLYDASLDAFKPHNWSNHFNVFRHSHVYLNTVFENRLHGFSWLLGNWSGGNKDGSLTYRAFPHEISANLWGYQYFNRRGKKMSLASRSLSANGAVMEKTTDAEGLRNADRDGLEIESAKQRKRAEGKDKSLDERQQSGQAGPDLSQVKARANLAETAFFFPHLVSNEEGVVRMEFSMPEALTKWKFMGFAHDAGLSAGFLTGSMVTAKDLMVRPNPPRFLREGDELEFTVKVMNRSAARQTGKVRLTFADARTRDSRDAALGNDAPELSFSIPAKQSKTFSWRIRTPDDLDFLTYKAVAATNRLSDGEVGNLPVLSRRIFVTESLPLPIRGAKTKKFRFDKLIASAGSDTLKHKGYTVQMVSQPAWYAVMALPYLMEYPHECSEQTFNRYYANLLAAHIAGSDPKIRRIFDLWKAEGEPLDSPLEKNEDLKAVALMETPWVRQAKSESQARRNVGILFDENRLAAETGRAFRKLVQMQRADGAWPWFPGGPGNDYLTLYVTTGFARLRHLDVETDVAPALKALNRLDGWVNVIYRRILKHGHKDQNNLSPTIALYLYGRSFYLKDRAIPEHAKEAVDYFLGQAREYWLQLANRQSQGHLALALHRFDDGKTAKAIMRSIKQRSVTDPEMGRFWRDAEHSHWWYRAPIETQALMIEAFDEVMDDAKAVEDCRVWLLKQKQTQDWKTTKATADATYGLLLRGKNLLGSDQLVEVALAGVPVKPEKVEAGTGFYEKRFDGSEVRPDFGKITLTKRDEGVSWGSVHWQYLEDVSKITPHEGAPLTLKKSLYLKKVGKSGPVLVPARGQAEVGDELVVRIELRSDRDVEYVHMKDQRPSGTEPVNVLSRYRYRDGLAYYESTKDVASHFYFDYLPKGVYVFEYSLRVQHRGQYQTGMANVQCMYAPEFNSHSQSFALKVE